MHETDCGADDDEGSALAIISEMNGMHSRMPGRTQHLHKEQVAHGQVGASLVYSYTTGQLVKAAWQVEQ